VGCLHPLDVCHVRHRAFLVGLVYIFILHQSA
jgi:hypothetical protein